MSNKQENASVKSGTEALRTDFPYRRKRNLTLVTLLFIIIALGVTLAYFLFWQHEEETEDAYVAGHLVQITPQITGTVRKVMFDDTELVKKGDVLITLDDSDFQLAYDRAQNELIQAIRQNKQQTATNSQAKAQVLLRKADLARAQADLRRRELLSGTDAISGEELSHARAAVVQAQGLSRMVEAAMSRSKQVRSPQRYCRAVLAREWGQFVSLCAPTASPLCARHRVRLLPAGQCRECVQESREAAEEASHSRGVDMRQVRQLAQERGLNLENIRNLELGPVVKGLVRDGVVAAEAGQVACFLADNPEIVSNLEQKRTA